MMYRSATMHTAQHQTWSKTDERRETDDIIMRAERSAKNDLKEWVNKLFGYGYVLHRDKLTMHI